jgi:hypothetical protein
MAVSNPVKSRMTWPQIRQSSDYKGRWVALDHCRYDSRTAQPVEGVVVDVDEDLVELCSRIQESDNKHCAILFCEDVPQVEAVSERASLVSPRPYTTH